MKQRQIFLSNNWVVSSTGILAGTFTFLRKYHDIKLRIWHSCRMSPENVLPFSCKSSSNKVDVRSSSQAPLAMSIAHYLLITGNLKGMNKMHLEKCIHVLLIANRAKPLNSPTLGYFIRKVSRVGPCLHVLFLLVQLDPAQQNIEHLSLLGSHEPHSHRS